MQASKYSFCIFILDDVDFVICILSWQTVGFYRMNSMEEMPFSQVQKIPNLAYQIYQTLQIYWVYEKDYIKYKYDRKWKTENMAEKHNFQV